MTRFRVSGVEWAPRIPADWSVEPFFKVFRETKQRNSGLEENNLLSLSYGRVVRKNIDSSDGLLPASFESYQIVEPDTIVFRFTDLQNDQRSLRTARVRERGIITSAYGAATPAQILPAYADYLMRSYDTTKVFYAFGGGVRQSLMLRDIARLPILVPPETEQRAIADYLDRETAQIDTLIAKQGQLITTLRERRGSVIDSVFGPEEETRPTRLRHLLSARPTYGVLVPRYADEYETPLVRVGDLLKMTSATSLAKISAEQSLEYSRTILRGGEVLLGVVGNMGQATVAPDWLAGANVARAVAVLRCSEPAAAPLLATWFGSTWFRDQANQATAGDSVQPTLGMADLASFRVNWPATATLRNQVTLHVSRKISAIDDLIARIERFTDLAKERRAALITAAVTGQLDVQAA